MNHEEISKYSELIDFILEKFDEAQIDLNTKHLLMQIPKHSGVMGVGSGLYEPI